MPNTTDFVTARECADRWGVGAAQARRILAPVTPTGRDITTGALLYIRRAADDARSAMPGRGHRTDLR
ncbi:hypothetical protein ACIQGZ_17360 [Streptomyces sp. NPDC092296]|uniref:hypothetical protein n=1 Tax=Streptomyces sp. NPDC092296 TaxID=3366012 RepID=UPI0037FA06D6